MIYLYYNFLHTQVFTWYDGLQIKKKIIIENTTLALAAVLPG